MAESTLRNPGQQADSALALTSSNPSTLAKPSPEYPAGQRRCRTVTLPVVSPPRTCRNKQHPQSTECSACYLPLRVTLRVTWRLSGNDRERCVLGKTFDTSVKCYLALQGRFWWRPSRDSQGTSCYPAAPTRLPLGSISFSWKSQCQVAGT